MKNKGFFLDGFVVSGFVASFFNGFLNPFYVSMILVRLDARTIALGSFMASAFPVLIGAALGSRALFSRLSAALPAVMLVELVLSVAAALLVTVNLSAYYLASMMVLGVFSSAVIYLLQKVKEVRYRGRRAAFDRRIEMADGAGVLAGSALGVVGVSLLSDPRAVAALGALQVGIVYGLFLLLHRRVPAGRRRRADEEPHPWGASMSLVSAAAA